MIPTSTDGPFPKNAGDAFCFIGKRWLVSGLSWDVRPARGPNKELQPTALNAFLAVRLDTGRWLGYVVRQDMNPALNKLSWSVRALAQPAQIQKSLFPSFVVFADELALEFDEHYENALPFVNKQCSMIQLSKLGLLEKKLESMSGSGKPHLWLDDDCLEHPEWTVVRALAQDVISEFDWSTEIPPPCDAIYVGGSSNPD